MKKKFVVATILIAFFAFTLLLLPREAFSRAGRGGSYRAPSRSSGSSSSSSGSYRRSTSSGSSSSSSRRSSSSGTYRSTGTTRSASTPVRTSTSTPYSSSSTSSDNYSDSSFPGASGALCCAPCGFSGFFMIAVIVIIIILILNKKKAKTGSGPDSGGGNFIPMGGEQYAPPAPCQQPGYDNQPQALPPIDEEKVNRQIEELRQKDPNFSSKVFLDKIQTYFYEIQRAWSKGNLEPARHRMSEAQFTRMKFQLDELNEKNWKNILEDIVIGGVKIADVGIEGEYDSIKVRIHASMRDRMLDANGKLVEGSNEITPFAEYWTFIRRQGAKSGEDGGKTPSTNCPNCGAPMTTIDVSKCPYCSTTLSSGAFDWVLDCITQSVEEDYQ